MLKSLVLAVVFAVVMIAAPVGKSQKEISTANASPLAETMTDLIFATANQHPCAIIVVASNDSVVPLPKSRPAHLGAKHKKKIVGSITKHKKKIVGHHHFKPPLKHYAPDDAPTKFYGANGPSHLTAPLGCG